MTGELRAPEALMLLAERPAELTVARLTRDGDNSGVDIAGMLPDGGGRVRTGLATNFGDPSGVSLYISFIKAAPTLGTLRMKDW